MIDIVERLISLIDEHGWADDFQAAIDRAGELDVPAMAHVRTLDDYLASIERLALWTPQERGDSRIVHDKMVEFYFVLDRSPLRELQKPACPGDASIALSPLAEWIHSFVSRWGEYLDTPESIAHLDSFRTNPAFRWDDYMPPPSGYRTFNQFFARHVRPGKRPIAAIGDSDVLVSPADAVFIGSWPITSDSTIAVDGPEVDVKGLRWSMRQLLAGSVHADRFAGGLFMHSALRTYDYHRWHSPVPGTVVEVLDVMGQAWLDVEVLTHVIDGRAMRRLQAVEGTGYQFAQARAIVVIESPHGLVACVPVGMGHVSSVVVTVGAGTAIHKGEELGYFQFGGSDFVMVFERSCRVELTCRVGTHYLQGSQIGLLPH